MDEQVLFDRFHEALDTRPRPGAYERMRVALTERAPAARRPRPFRMRFTKMSYRVAAAVAVAAILIAAAGILAATHHTTTSSIPATDQNTKAYQTLVASDYNKMAASTSTHCNTIDDIQCAAAIGRVVPALQAWVDDLNAYQTPPQYTVLDGQLRRHLTEAIVELQAAVAFQKTHDEAGFNAATDAAQYERAWIDPTSFELEGTSQDSAGTFSAAMSAIRSATTNCVNGTPKPADVGCLHLAAGDSCPGTDALRCNSDVQAVETQLQGLLISLEHNPAPSASASKARDLQQALAAADTAALGITDALLKRDTARLNDSRNQFVSAIRAAQGIASTM